jgi:hypothetical protein
MADNFGLKIGINDKKENRISKCISVFPTCVSSKTAHPIG